MMTATPLIVDFGDLQLAYRDEGPANGPVLVLAHAMSFDQSMWDAVISHLPSTLRIIRYDHRGHGASSSPPAPYMMGALVRDAERLLDHLSLRDCVFCGISMGGMVAQGLAVKRLDLVRGLVLANTAVKIGTKESWANLVKTAQSQGLEAMRPGAIEALFSARFRAAGLATPWSEALQNARPEAWFGCVAALAGTDFYTTTAGLRLPSLVIASSDDAITPADLVRETADLIPGSQFHLIRKSGHLPPIEQPDAFASALAAFLTGIGHV
jgi:3-oxoadipate enol-lactonase